MSDPTAVHVADERPCRLRMDGARRDENRLPATTVPAALHDVSREGREQSPPLEWATGWYVRKRHVYEMQPARVDGSVSAICSRYTGVYPNGTTSRSGHEVPMGNSPEVMALPACKLCLRLTGNASGQTAPVPAMTAEGVGRGPAGGSSEAASAQEFLDARQAALVAAEAEFQAADEAHRTALARLIAARRAYNRAGEGWLYACAAVPRKDRDRTAAT